MRIKEPPAVDNHRRGWGPGSEGSVRDAARRSSRKEEEAGKENPCRSGSVYLG